MGVNWDELLRSGTTSWPMLLDCGVKFMLAVGLAGAVGFERQRKGRPAGLRTHILVCLGSTLLMAMSDIFANDWSQEGAPVWFDRGRVAAGIVTGVGFLGAGTIINIGAKQHGLTTAAMIWFVASLGVALGSGYYLIAILATVIALVTVLGLGALEHVVPSRGYFTLRLSLPKDQANFENIEKFVKRDGTIPGAPRAHDLRRGKRHRRNCFPYRGAIHGAIRNVCRGRPGGVFRGGVCHPRALKALENGL